TPGRREAALRRAADRVETALAGLERPLGRYLLDLEGEVAEGRSWFGEPGPGELVDWEPVLTRAGVHAAPHRVAAVYLELAVLVRALEGLATRVRWASRLDRGSLWAGLFDLRENLLGSALDDLRALAACSSPAAGRSGTASAPAVPAVPGAGRRTLSRSRAAVVAAASGRLVRAPAIRAAARRRRARRRARPATHEPRRGARAARARARRAGRR